MFKTFEDVQKIAALGRSDEVLDKFIYSYLAGLKLRAQYEDVFVSESGECPSDEGFRNWLAEQQCAEQWEIPHISDDEVEEFRRENYAVFRAGNYPPVEMYMDAIAKGDIGQIEQYKGLCLANKERFPKPEQEVTNE